MRVDICEVGPRDGLQNEPEVLDPTVRAELVTRLASTGVPRIEVASFVSARRVPQMADPEKVVALAEAPSPVTRAALVLNERGYERLAATDVPEVHAAFCVSETFNERNQGCPVADSVEATKRIIRRAHDDGRRVTVTLAASFGCPFEGEVDPGEVLAYAGEIREADEIVFADTIGVGVPRQVHRLLRGAADLDRPLGLHLHNTRNTGYANAYAALESEVSTLDASVAGIGGCPFAPDATGDIATEDLVYLLDREGVESGVDIDAVISVAEWLRGVLGRDLPGRLHRAGVFPPAS
ncbi:hydroxymethylglutaryl-CoA lyase [Solicola gregarius]|uniref:Hydroxymethylglutaryl-CoA lyase n=1 Tax=Solicola gregarius TaxID=2908642 RepID=A0AA46YJR9_9ACTN|nr:hydroxymethylglutaryl-CoA lyase [Solicola gregarius]UYM03884.1 hydroxymethylglutaryl-CoA lyase [Solicola gregarius]